jgi:glycosyltransferase involved in cell wall biosynthesis
MNYFKKQLSKVEDNQILVSIIVITYNSEKYLLETLESAKAQTYNNIELIITDDASQDKTVQICKNWLVENSNRFVRSKLLTIDENTGIPSNCNRGIIESKGQWIKLIAGDDILLNDCITFNLEYINYNTNCKILLSKCQIFNKVNDFKYYLYELPFPYQIDFFNLTAKDQYKNLLIRNFVWNSPSSFISRDFLFKNGLFDKKFKLIEDLPFWLKITKNGTKLQFLNKTTVLQRKCDSVTNPDSKWINEMYYHTLKQFFMNEIAPDLKKNSTIIYFKKIMYFFKIFILINYFANKKSIKAKLFNKFFNLLIPNQEL